LIDTRPQRPSSDHHCARTEVRARCTGRSFLAAVRDKRIQLPPIELLVRDI
jgi:hypothetical protein